MWQEGAVAARPQARLVGCVPMQHRQHHLPKPRGVRNSRRLQPPAGSLQLPAAIRWCWLLSCCLRHAYHMPLLLTSCAPSPPVYQPVRCWPASASSLTRATRCVACASTSARARTGWSCGARPQPTRRCRWGLGRGRGVRGLHGKIKGGVYGWGVWVGCIQHVWMSEGVGAAWVSFVPASHWALPHTTVAGMECRLPGR